MATTAPNVTLLDDHRRAPLLPMALRAPATAVRSVRRHALLERLQASTEPVVALSAPAGYGKSTVLAQWAEADERPFAWVRGCDGAEPAMLLGYVAAALRELVDIPMGLASLPVICQALTTIPRSYVIVLDGVDRFDGAGCSAIVGAVADHLPAGSKLAVAGRSLPAMPLTRLRAEARVLDLTDADLALTDDETVVFLNDPGHAARPSSELLASIQGWPAALALSVHANGDGAGCRRLVADYLRAALMD